MTLYRILLDTSKEARWLISHEVYHTAIRLIVCGLLKNDASDIWCEKLHPFPFKTLEIFLARRVRDRRLWEDGPNFRTTMCLWSQIHSFGRIIHRRLYELSQ